MVLVSSSTNDVELEVFTKLARVSGWFWLTGTPISRVDSADAQACYDDSDHDGDDCCVGTRFNPITHTIESGRYRHGELVRFPAVRLAEIQLLLSVIGSQAGPPQATASGLLLNT